MPILLLGLVLLFGVAPPASAAPIDELAAAAKKEGVLELLAPSTTGDKGAQALGAAFNKMQFFSLRSLGRGVEDTGRSSDIEELRCER